MAKYLQLCDIVYPPLYAAALAGCAIAAGHALRRAGADRIAGVGIPQAGGSLPPGAREHPSAIRREGHGADRAAVRRARLGRQVKKMAGGVEGWKDEGFSLEAAPARDLRLPA